jgi:hypothetical protein
LQNPNRKLLCITRHYATSGVYYREGGERAEIGRTLELTKKGEVADIFGVV